MKAFFPFQKALFLVIVLFLNTKGFSQKAFIITTENKKIVIDDNSINVDTAAEKVTYKAQNSSEQTEIKFKKIKSAVIGDYKMDRIKPGDEKIERLCFTIAETKEKKLIGYNLVANIDVYSPHNKIKQVKQQGDPTAGYETKTTTIYSYYIVDKNNKTIEKLKCIESFGDEFADERSKAEKTIKAHFSDCKELLDRFKSNSESNNKDVQYSEKMKKMVNTMKDGKYYVVQFFENQRFCSCDPTATNNVTPTAKKEEIKSDFGFQNYTIGVISIDFKGMKRDVPLTGTFTIKNDVLSIVTKDASVNYKIISFENGILKYQDGDVVQTVNISNDTGKIKGFQYDSKISIIDKNTGGATVYWCIKK